jgi:hypothetical protein
MSGWRTLQSWFRTVTCRSRANRDIGDTYARLDAPPTVVRDACRDQGGISLLDDFVRDLRHGARLLRRNPGFTAIVVSTLAIAIGATVAVFSIVDAWLFRPLNFPDAERLVIAFGARPERPSEPAVWLPYRVFDEWKERSGSFTSVSAAFVRDVTLTTEADARSLLGLDVTPDFFRTFGVSSLIGRTLSEQDVNRPAAVVLTYGLWQRHFGCLSDVIGTAIRLSRSIHTRRSPNSSVRRT